eukprot:scaffold92695_cov12-Tisochrysis_lutea.AAC.1
MSESFCAENKSAQTCPASLPGPPAKQLAFVVSIKWLYPGLQSPSKASSQRLVQQAQARRAV